MNMHSVALSCSLVLSALLCSVGNLCLWVDERILYIYIFFFLYINFTRLRAASPDVQLLPTAFDHLHKCEHFYVIRGSVVIWKELNVAESERACAISSGRCAIPWVLFLYRRSGNCAWTCPKFTARALIKRKTAESRMAEVTILTKMVTNPRWIMAVKCGNGKMLSRLCEKKMHVQSRSLVYC